MRFMQKKHKRMKKRILIVVGTRPNFVKVTRFKKVAENYDNIDLRIVHTGQHYDNKMSEIFLKQFGIEIDYFLNISNKSANSLIGEIILKLENVINVFKPDLLLSVGDVNSTLAASICANKLQVKLGHIESGLRSLDRGMPEEINRIITDELSDICFITEKSGIQNLKNIGKTDNQLAFVGNTMIDTLIHFNNDIEKSTVIDDLKLKKDGYILVTMHRPSNVDMKSSASKIVELLKDLTIKCKVVFPMHPRTINSLKSFNLLDSLNEINNLIVVEPQGYFSFQKLIKNSFCVITDSGGIQEETTFRKIPCITLRENTERPITITEGTNVLMSFENKKIIEVLESVEQGTFKKGTIPELWDGNATNRIIEKCFNFIS